jgi:hypothetical protein
MAQKYGWVSKELDIYAIALSGIHSLGKIVAFSCRPNVAFVLPECCLVLTIPVGASVTVAILWWPQIVETFRLKVNIEIWMLY